MKIKKKGNPKLLISFRNLEEILNQNFDSFDICDLKDTEKGSIGA